MKKNLNLDHRRRARIGYCALGVLSLLYILIMLSAPIDVAAQRYNLSTLQIRSLQLSVTLPIIGIWFVALWGSLRFKRYAASIAMSKDGQALMTVANGLLLLVGGLSISAVATSYRSLLNGTAWFSSAVIVANYLNVILVLLAFAVIYRGTRKLGALVDFRGMRSGRLAAAAALLVMGGIYAWLLAMNPYRQASPDITKITPYYISDWLILVTLVVPYLVIWYLGIMSVVFSLIYQKYTPGIVYRQSLWRLSLGLLAVVLSSVIIQLIGAVGPSLAHLGIASILIILYMLILVYAVGHLLVANGARKLSQLEEAV